MILKLYVRGMYWYYLIARLITYLNRHKVISTKTFIHNFLPFTTIPWLWRQLLSGVLWINLILLLYHKVREIKGNSPPKKNFHLWFYSFTTIIIEFVIINVILKKFVCFGFSWPKKINNHWSSHILCHKNNNNNYGVF